MLHLRWTTLSARLNGTGLGAKQCERIRPGFTVYTVQKKVECHANRSAPLRHPFVLLEALMVAHEALSAEPNLSISLCASLSTLPQSTLPVHVLVAHSCSVAQRVRHVVVDPSEDVDREADEL